MKKQTVIGWLCRRLRRRIPGLVLMTLTSIMTAALGVMFALGSKNVINSAVSGTRQELIQAAVWQALVILGMLFFSALQRYCNSRLEAELDQDWKRELTHRILRSDYAKIADYHSGELINRLNNDVRAVDEGVLTILPSLASMITRLVAAVAVLSTMVPLFTVLLVVAGAVLIGITALARKRLRKLNKAVSQANGKVSGFLQEIFEKLLLVQAMNVEQEVERRGDKLMRKRYALQKKRWTISLAANTCVQVLGYVSGFVALVWCAFGLSQGTMTFGELMAVTQLVSQLQSPFVALSGALPKYIALVASGERLMELEEACENEEAAPVCDRGVYDKVQEICADALGFAYDRDMVFRDCSFALPKGAFAVITGPSGIGKSTLLKLLLGIFKPNEGKLYFSENGVQRAADRSTRSLFAYVPQGNLLFSGTLRENLLLTKRDATEEQIQRAIYVSNMDAYLSQLPQGLETVLGENAHGLSEGQAQRLSIARAILDDAPILLLDEATSALDAESEATVLRRIRQLQDKTCIAVTHRPGAMELADWQLKVEKGSITCQKIEK